MRSETRSRQPSAYYLRRALDSIVATPVVTSVTITSIAVSVLFAGAVLLVGSNAYRLVAHWGTQGVDVSVYLEPGVTDDVVVELRNSLRADPVVVEVAFISQEEAWQFLADNLGDSVELLDGLEPAALPASLELTLTGGLDREVLEDRLRDWGSMATVDDVQYNRAWTDGLRNAMSVVRWLAWALGSLALVASTIIVGATFQLAAFSRREEMEVLKLVGAVGSVFWGPALLAGFIEGLVGSVAALLVLALVYQATATPLAAELPVVGASMAFLTVGQSSALAFWGVGLGVAGSWLGLRRLASW